MFGVLKLSIAIACLACIACVQAIPSFDGVFSWSTMNSLVPGMSALTAIGPDGKTEIAGTSNYVDILAPRGSPGNTTIHRNRVPPLFYIYQDQLWHYHNDSTILPVNVYNTTQSVDLPLQLIVGEKQAGITGGRWRWQGTMLFYDRGQQTNEGLFYHCQDNHPEGLKGLYMFLQCKAPPRGCIPFTIHSWSRREQGV